MSAKRIAHFVLCIAILAGLWALPGCKKGGNDKGNAEADPTLQSGAAITEPPSPNQTVLSPQAIEKSLSAAAQYVNTAQYGQAKAILSVLIQRAPDDLRAREQYGQLLAFLAIEAANLGDALSARILWEEAYEQYRMAVALDPESSGLLHSAGMIAFSAGKHEQALEHYLEAARLDTLNPQPLVFAAQVLISSERLDEAQIQLEKALVLDPDEPVIHASLGLIDMQRERYEEAIEHIAEARRIAPHDIGILVQQARIFRRSGDPNRALELLISLDDQQKIQEAVVQELAAGYEALDRPGDAAQAWVHRIHIKNDYPTRWRDAINAARAYLKAGEKQRAWSWLQEAKLVAPQDEAIRKLEAAFGDT